MDPMLRKALRAQRELRIQLDNMLLGDEGDIVEAELKKFVAKRVCWAKLNPKARIFTLNPEPFNPVSFIGEGWSIWYGPINDNGLEGKKGVDKRSLALYEVDMASIHFENMLNEEDDEETISGEDKILRMKMAKFVRLDARLGRDLIAEPGHSTLEWLYKKRKIKQFDLPGTLLRNPDGFCYILFLYRNQGRWNWIVQSLEDYVHQYTLSAVLAS